MRRALWAAVLVAVAAACAAWVAGCERAGKEAGGEVGGGTPRVVVLSPAAGVTLRDMGLEGWVVGRHGFDLALDPSLPVCGDQGGIDYEALLRVRPTHVVIQWGSRELPGRLTSLARERGWVIENYNPLSLSEIDAASASLARALGVEASRAPSVSAALAGMERAGYGGRVLLLAGVDPPAALGPGSFHHDMLVALGAKPALERGGPWVTLDAEDVRNLSPDAMLLILPRAPGAPGGPGGRGAAQERLGRLGTLDVPAVREGRVAVIDDPLAHTPSTAMIGVAGEMAGVLRGWGR